jgi:hypothetical protein
VRVIIADLLGLTCSSDMTINATYKAQPAMNTWTAPATSALEAVTGPSRQRLD